MRRLFGADSLRSDNPFSLGPPPPCGATAADSLRSPCGATAPPCGASGPPAPRP